MAQVVCRRSFKVEVRAQTHVQSRWYFVVEKVASGKVFLLVLPLFPVTVILPVLRIHSFIYHRRYIMCGIESVVK